MHDPIIIAIIKKEFGRTPSEIRRMSNGICNEVYTVDIGEREVIVRLHTEPRYMFGSHNHIPIFKSKGIRVPEILAEDYSKSYLPYAFQILSMLEGEDINNVIHTLSNDELRAIAAEIANVFIQLREVPNNGKFGVLWGDADDLVDSWTADIKRMTRVVLGWGARTGVLDDSLADILASINSEYKTYFDNIRPITYYGDICAKNVMIFEGRFSGLVDLDALAQGDPLEAVGRIKASWYGTEHGSIYSNAVMDALELHADQRRIVAMYAVLNRTYWTMENGIQFNQNTSPEVDRAREKHDKSVLEAMLKEVEIHKAIK